ncbi:MAG: phage major capsid protein, partial [Caulobacteraceae bacterium]
MSWSPMRHFSPSRLFAGSAAIAPPSGVIGRVQANADDPKKILKGIEASFTDFQAQNNQRLGHIEASLDEMNVSAAAGRAGAGAVRQSPEDAAYSKAYAAFFRTGEQEVELRAANSTGQRQAIRAAMSEGTDGAGGYLAPVEWDRKIVQQQRLFSPMRKLATVVESTVRGYSTVWSDGGWGTGWVGETAIRPQTANPNLSPLSFVAGQLYAQPAITQDLLDDAQFDTQGWLANEVGQVFAVQEGIAFVSGDGVNKPQGLLTYTSAALHPGGAVTQITTENSGAISGDDLIALVYSLTTPYRPGAAFLMNSVTAGIVSAMKDASGRYLWQPSLQLGQPATLLGFPVETDETMPNAVAGAIPIVFGNFARGYVINDRLGTTVLRDPYTAKPYVLFYTRKRVGGGVRD